MVSLRSGKMLQTDNAKAVKSSETRHFPSKKMVEEDRQSPIAEGKKRKAQDPAPKEGEGGEMNPPSTPKSQVSQFSDEPNAETKAYEKTPGRVGPIKPDDFSVKPDIKPFKGLKGQKVRKTAHEKNEEYTQFSRDNEGHTFHELHVCYDKGPNGSPTYDKAGFELDYHKVAEWMRPKPYNKGALVRGMDRAVEKRDRERSRMAEIFFEKGEAPSDVLTTADDYWKDRVSKDMNIPWHKVGVEQFEEWEKKGFKKARRGEYEKFSKDERDRMLRMMSGASLRR